jgi:hypothetical protein
VRENRHIAAGEQAIDATCSQGMGKASKSISKTTLKDRDYMKRGERKLRQNSERSSEILDYRVLGHWYDCRVCGRISENLNSTNSTFV